MNVVKRDGTVEQVKFDKISSRIRKQTYGLNEDYVDYFQVAQKVISGLVLCVLVFGLVCFCVELTQVPNYLPMNFPF